MKVAICIKICPPDVLQHEYIRVGEVLAIKAGVCIRPDSFGHVDLICEVGSRYFKEHFELIENIFSKSVDIEM